MLTQEVIISASRLNKTFIGEKKRPKPVLRDVTLAVHAGEFVTILGQSGSGKSTLLRMLAGLIPPDSGTLTLAGKPVDGPSANVGMVFQSYALYPWLTVYDNIAFGVRLFEKLSRADMDERVQWALTKAALWNETKDKLHQSGYSLSGGQQQRLCIARGIAIRPEVLLLDEPCSALDPISTGKIEELISELKADYTVVIVTHNMQQAARCSDSTAFMYLGELIEFSDTDNLFTAPQKKQTEDYITGRYG